jgi:hypothetical protein
MDTTVKPWGRAGECQGPRRTTRQSGCRPSACATAPIYIEDRGITTLAAIDAAIGLQGGEVVRLLTRRQWREGDTAALKAIAGRLGLDVPLEGLSLPMREGKGP